MASQNQAMSEPSSDVVSAAFVAVGLTAGTLNTLAVPGGKLSQRDGWVEVFQMMEQLLAKMPTGTQAHDHWVEKIQAPLQRVLDAANDVSEQSPHGWHVLENAVESFFERFPWGYLHVAVTVNSSSW